MSQIISQVEAPAEKSIDREKICPLLLRIFCSSNRHNPLSEYSRGSAPQNELQIYTWMDCTLRELMSLIKDVNPDARKRGTEFSFAIVSPDRHSARYVMKDIGSTVSGTRGPDDLKTLAQCKFEVGDFIDVAITLNAQPLVGGPRGGNVSFGSSFGGGGRRISVGGGGNGGPGPRGGPSFGRFRD